MSLFRTALMIAATVLFTMTSCDSGNQQSRRTANGRVGQSEDAGDQADGGTAGVDQTGGTGTSADGDSGEGTGETSGDTGDDGEETAYEPDETLTYLNYARDVIASKCLSCHLANSVGLGDYVTVNNNSLLMLKVLKNKTMPEGGGLADEDRTKLIGWILAGSKKGPPSMQVLEPATLNTSLLEDTYQINVTIADNLVSGTWGLFYTTMPDDTTNGTAIVTDQYPAADNTVNWDLTAVPNGTYYIYAKIVEEETVITAKAPGSVTKGPYIKMDPVWKTGTNAYQQPVDMPFTVVNATGAGPYLVKVEAKMGELGAFSEWDPGSADLTKFNISGRTEAANYYIKISLLENGVVVSTDMSVGPVGIADAAYTYTFTNLRTDFFGPSCDGCHTGVGAGTGVFLSDLYDDPLGAAPNRKGPTILLRVGNDTMPPGGGILDLPKTRLKLWYMLGGPE